LPPSLDQPKVMRCDISERRIGDRTLQGRLCQYWSRGITTTRTIVVALAALLLPAVLAQADYYYYGVADDQFLDDNDTLWAALAPYPEWDAPHATLRDNWDADDGVRTDGRDSVYDDLAWYAGNLESGDVFMFSYSGHGGWQASDSYYPDEGSTPRPLSNDPTPANDPPYEYDEFFGYSGGTSYMWDDDLTEIFQNFNSGVEVIVLSGACHSGGWVGGSHDINTSVPANNNGLYAILGAPEQGLSVGVRENGEDYYEILLTTALSNSLETHMTMSDWYEAAMEYGETACYTGQAPWDESPQDYYYWPDENWVPTTHEETYYDYANDQLDHWGWQETYLQLRPEEFASLDAAHDYLMGTPEPASATLFVLGTAAIALRLRRRRRN